VCTGLKKTGPGALELHSDHPGPAGAKITRVTWCAKA
jgi:hypothetical protein